MLHAIGLTQKGQHDLSPAFHGRSLSEATLPQLDTFSSEISTIGFTWVIIAELSGYSTVGRDPLLKFQKSLFAVLYPYLPDRSNPVATGRREPPGAISAEMHQNFGKLAVFQDSALPCNARIERQRDTD